MYGLFIFGNVNIMYQIYLCWPENMKNQNIADFIINSHV